MSNLFILGPTTGTAVLIFLHEGALGGLTGVESISATGAVLYALVRVGLEMARRQARRSQDARQGLTGGISEGVELLGEPEPDRRLRHRCGHGDLRRGQVLTEGPDQEARGGDDPDRDAEQYGVLHGRLKIKVHTTMMPAGSYPCTQDPLVRSSLVRWATRRRRTGPTNQP